MLSDLNAKDAHWQVIVEDFAYGYSAHLDARTNCSFVWVFGAVRARKARFFCQLWTSSTDQIANTSAKVDVVDNTKVS